MARRRAAPLLQALGLGSKRGDDHNNDNNDNDNNDDHDNDDDLEDYLGLLLFFKLLGLDPREVLQ